MEICSELAPMLHGLFLELAKYAKGAIQRALGRDNEGANSTGTKNMATKAVGKRDAKVNHTATSKPSGAEDRASVWFEETDSSSGTEEFMNSKDLNLDGTSFTGRLAFDESRPLNDTTPRASIEDTTPRASTDTANRPGVHGDPLDRKLPPAELDALLPKVCEALVLVTQCIVTVCLEAEENPAMSGRDKLKDNFNENQVVGIVESLIGEASSTTQAM